MSAVTHYRPCLIESALLLAVFTGLLMVSLLPAARGSHVLLGWWPLWSVGMPASALLVLWFRRAVAAQGAILAAPLRRRPRRGRNRRRSARTPGRRWLLAALHPASG